MKNPGKGNAMNPIFARTSVRQWTDEPVEDEQILNILKAGMQAPSAMNARPWSFVVVTNAKLKKQLSEISPYAHFAAEAPVLLAVLCHTDNACPPYNAIDMGICIENMLLEITAQNLGGVCLGVAPLKERMEAMAKLLKLKEGIEPYALIPFGHPAGPAKVQDRFDPKRIEWIR